MSERAQNGAASRRILVIEDDAVSRFNMVSYLEDSGFEVAEEPGGASGLERARASSPDLVLCDLRLPDLDGLDVLQTLHSEQPDLPLVVVSGTGVMGDAIEALRKGAWDFITKPIPDMAMLEHAVTAALDRARLIADNRRFQQELEHANRKLRENLEQFEQDAAAGRILQQQLMPPRERRIGAYRFSRYLLPSLTLSGDFVDYFPIDRRHIGFYLADVSGHGISSALVTVLLKSFVQRLLEAGRGDYDPLLLAPADLMARLNTYLLEQKLDKYLTMFYGVIDTQTHRLRYCNGGHFPNPLLFDGSAARYLEGRGTPLGLFAGAAFDEVERALPSTALLVLCSDGVLDALPEQSLAARQDRLREAVRHAGLTPESLLTTLGLAPDAPGPDDITLLIAEQDSGP